jgi:hypothetical protein
VFEDAERRQFVEDDGEMVAGQWLPLPMSRTWPPDRNKSLRTRPPLRRSFSHFTASGRGLRKLAAVLATLAMLTQPSTTRGTEGHKRDHTATDKRVS